MRLIHFTTATGLALASAGGLMWYLGSRGEPGEGGTGKVVANAVQVGPKHPVTELMLRETAKLSKQTAAPFSVRSLAGGPVSIGGTQPLPQFLLFIKRDCPCSVDAQPIFNSLARHYEGKVRFVGVVDGDILAARKWVANNPSAFPVVADPSLAIVHAYRAKSSVYSALVSKDGRVEHLWPGYSIEMLKEMNRDLAALVGEKVREFDTAYAPVAKTSGCAFAQ
jgi:hypothetical protein